MRRVCGLQPLEVVFLLMPLLNLEGVLSKMRASLVYPKSRALVSIVWSQRAESNQPRCMFACRPLFDLFLVRDKCLLVAISSSLYRPTLLILKTR